MKPLVWRVWVQATMPSKCLRTIRATSFIGSTLERRTLVHHCLSMAETTLICLRSRIFAQMLTIEPNPRRALGGSLGDQGVEIGATFVGEAIAILEQGPAQPFEAGVGALFEPPHLVDGVGGMGHDVELVEGDAGIGQMLPHAFDEGGRH